MHTTDQKTSGWLLTKRTIALALIAIIIVSAFLGIIYNRKYGNLNASALVSVQGIGVYQNYGCTTRVSSVNWGNLTAGSTKNVKVYVRNEVNESRILSVSPGNWIPTGASSKLAFSWKSTATEIPSGGVANVTLTLYVPKTISGIQTFSFDIIVGSSSTLPGDVNNDGKVDLRDVQIVLLAMFSSPGSHNWNPNADLDGNSIIDLRDLSIDLLYFGNEAQ